MSSPYYRQTSTAHFQVDIVAPYGPGLGISPNFNDYVTSPGLRAVHFGKEKHHDQDQRRVHAQLGSGTTPILSPSYTKLQTPRYSKTSLYGMSPVSRLPTSAVLDKPRLSMRGDIQNSDIQTSPMLGMSQMSQSTPIFGPTTSKPPFYKQMTPPFGLRDDEWAPFVDLNRRHVTPRSQNQNREGSTSTSFPSSQQGEFTGDSSPSRATHFADEDASPRSRDIDKSGPAINRNKTSGDGDQIEDYPPESESGIPDSSFPSGLLFPGSDQYGMSISMRADTHTHAHGEKKARSKERGQPDIQPGNGNSQKMAKSRKAVKGIKGPLALRKDVMDEIEMVRTRMQAQQSESDCFDSEDADDDTDSDYDSDSDYAFDRMTKSRKRKMGTGSGKTNHKVKTKSGSNSKQQQQKKKMSKTKNGNSGFGNSTSTPTSPTPTTNHYNHNHIPGAIRDFKGKIELNRFPYRLVSLLNDPTNPSAVWCTCGMHMIIIDAKKISEEFSVKEVSFWTDVRKHGFIRIRSSSAELDILLNRYHSGGGGKGKGKGRVSSSISSTKISKDDSNQFTVEHEEEEGKGEGNEDGNDIDVDVSEQESAKSNVNKCVIDVLKGYSLNQRQLKRVQVCTHNAVSCSNCGKDVLATIRRKKTPESLLDRRCNELARRPALLKKCDYNERAILLIDLWNSLDDTTLNQLLRSIKAPLRV